MGPNFILDFILILFVLALAKIIAVNWDWYRRAIPICLFWMGVLIIGFAIRMEFGSVPVLDETRRGIGLALAGMGLIFASRYSPH